MKNHSENTGLRSDPNKESVHIEILSEPIPVSMAEDWYDMANTEHFWMQWHYEFFKKILTGKHDLGNQLLEIGCGSGAFRKQLEQDLKIPVDGCDLNLSALQMADRGLGRLMLYNIFDKAPELTGRYSSIFMMDVVEHLDDDIGFLKAAAAHSKPGGLIFINVPAGMYLYSKYDTKAGHFRRHDLSSLNKLITDAGLLPLEIKYWGGLLIPLALLRKIVLGLSNNDEHIIKHGFAPPGKVSHTFLKLLKKFELLYPLKIPIGTSVFAIIKVPD